MKTLYIAGYFNNKYDYHKSVKLENNNFEYIRQYYESIIKNDVKSIIFYDNLSIDFIKKYSNDNVYFYRSDTIQDNMLIHDERFFHFHNYIKLRTDINYFLLSDISDVIIINPIENIIEVNDNTLYIGTEGENIMNNKWFINHHFKSYLENHINEIMPDYEQVFKNKIIRNCGVIYAHRKILVEFIGKMCEYIDMFYKETKIKKPVDMLVVNYVSYKYYNDNLYNGTKFNTQFAQNIYDITKCVKHK